MHRLVILLLMALMNFCVPANASMMSARIEGVADFLIERANETVIDTFEKKISTNALVLQYFPNTMGVLKTFDLKTLMLSDGLWKDNVEKDLNDFGEKLRGMLKNDTGKILGEDYSGLAPIIEKIERDYSASKYEVLLATCTDLVRLINENKKAISGDLLVDRESLEIAALLVGDIQSKVSLLQKMEVLQDSTTLKSLEKFNDRLASISRSLGYISCIFDTTRSYTERVSYLIMLAENCEEMQKIIQKNHRAYARFKMFAVFFAQLSDAKTKEDAKLALKTFALPPDSYMSKRKDNMRLSISSYLGFAGGIETYKSGSFFYYGLTAPIGLEASWGTRRKGSVSILGTVFDLGAVVNSQIYNTSESFSLRNIYAPGVGLIYGFPEMPLSLGMGYARVNSVKQYDRGEHRCYLFLGIDMPLFLLY